MNFLVKLHEVCRFHELHFIKFHESVDDDFMNFTSRTFEVMKLVKLMKFSWSVKIENWKSRPSKYDLIADLLDANMFKLYADMLKSDKQLVKGGQPVKFGYLSMMTVAILGVGILVDSEIVLSTRYGKTQVCGVSSLTVLLMYWCVRHKGKWICMGVSVSE